MKPTIYLSMIFLVISYLLFTIPACKVMEGEQWQINDGVLVLDNHQTDSKATIYWNHISTLLPKEILFKYVRSLKLFTDGKAGELGGMASLNPLNTEWELDIDTVDFNINNKDSIVILDYTHTLIHEFGHLLTLNPEQVVITDDKVQNDNLGYLTQEGYATQSSYLGQFVKQFWENALLEEWDEIERVRANGKRLKLLYDFYLANQQAFVTDYAAESPEEDIAESWTFFVLSDKPKLELVKYKKVNFFYNFPELVKYRQEIRSQLEFVPRDYLENYKRGGY